MEFTYNQRKTALEIILKGKLDIDKADMFEKEFTQIIDKTEEKTIGINLKAVEYIDSSGLGSLIKILNASKNNGKTLFLFGAAAKIQNIFQLARLEKFFTFITPLEFNSKYPTVDDEEMDSLINSL